MSPKRLVKRLDLQPHFAVLEIGPGPGYFSIDAALSVPQGRLILVDVQQEMLDMARDRLQKRGLANVDYLRGDAVALPLESGSIDVAFLVAVLGEIPDPQAALREIRRVLRAEGTLSLTEHTLGDPHSLSTRDLARMTEEAGFRMVAQHGRWLSRTVAFRICEGGTSFHHAQWARL